MRNLIKWAVITGVALVLMVIYQQYQINRLSNHMVDAYKYLRMETEIRKETDSILISYDLRFINTFNSYIDSVHKKPK